MKTKSISARKIIFSTWILFGVFLPLISSAAAFNYQPMEAVPGFAKTGDFYVYVGNIYKFGIGAVGICAVLMLMVGGYMYITSAGNNSQMGNAKGVIMDALIGVLLALTSYVILYTINPDLVRLGGVSGGTPSIEGVSKPIPATPTPTTTPTKSADCSFPVPTNGTNVCQGTPCTKKCDLSKYETIINKYATIYGIKSSIIKSVIYHESGCNPNASSDRHACGLMQVVPPNGTCENNSLGNLMDPETNIREGVKLLAKKYNQNSHYKYSVTTVDQQAFAAYNCCGNNDLPNAKSRDCGPDVPKWACPINPGNGKYNMCAVKKYVCEVSACAL